MTVAATQTAAIQTLASAANQKSTTGADFNMFLRLLTTQMQNQDPLDPMKSSEYTQQLAQYSQIEQTVQQSGTLKDILARLSTQDMTQASGLIGHDVVFGSTVSGLGAAPASWSFTPARSATTMVATVSDASGKAIYTQPIDPATRRYSWDGTLSTGGLAPNGAYSLAITGADSSGGDNPVTVNSIGRVDAVTLDKGVLSLGVNGASQPVSALLSVAAPAI